MTNPHKEKFWAGNLGLGLESHSSRMAAVPARLTSTLKKGCPDHKPVGGSEVEPYGPSGL